MSNGAELERIIVEKYGFESMQEFNELVASIDLSDAVKLAKFTEWRNEDGTKTGLLRILEE